MSPSSRNRMLALVALVAAGAALAFVAFGSMGKSLVYYWSPGEMLAQGPKAYHATIRLGGIVQAGSIQWDASRTSLHFRVADGKEPGAVAVDVQSDQLPPQMFREGIGVVVEGTFDSSKTFTAQRLMVNHSNEYRPPKPGERDNWKGTVADSAPPSGSKGR